MSLLKNEHRIDVAGAEVAVTAKTGTVHATWTLFVDGSEVDQAVAAGDFRLRGALPDGSSVEAQVHQSLLGPTEVSIVHDGAEVTRFKGFVA